MKDNEKAVIDFTKAIQVNNDLLLNIMNHMDNHMDINPDEVNYGHVGNAIHVLEQLKSITEFLNI